MSGVLHCHRPFVQLHWLAPTKQLSPAAEQLAPALTDAGQSVVSPQPEIAAAPAASPSANIIRVIVRMRRR